METIEGNKLIAKFMGAFKENGHSDNFRVLPLGGDEYYIDLNDEDSAKFHESWDWLMPVVEEIENTKMINGDWFMVSIGKFKVSIIRKCRLGNPYFDDEIYHVDTMTKIDATWNAVVEFVEWYNAHKK